MGLYATKIFPWVLDITEPVVMEEHRRLLLCNVTEKVLELGVGTGANLAYYPKQVTRITVLEPSDAMRKRALQKASKLELTLEWHRGKAELMPFENDCFNTVVCVDVLCSVDDVDAVLQEAHRVLKPGGCLYFLDHGISKDKKIRKMQNRLNGLSKVIACGCHLNRDIEAHMRKSDFRIEEMVNVAPLSGLNALYPHIRGIAAKLK